MLDSYYGESTELRFVKLENWKQAANLKIHKETSRQNHLGLHEELRRIQNIHAVNNTTRNRLLHTPQEEE